MVMKKQNASHFFGSLLTRIWVACIG